ncbi:hypothetical protein Btru_068854 [Bulinus truncatus]|nr:hypothetical protein Btru_068854 [Bulinus truncatus]
MGKKRKKNNREYNQYMNQRQHQTYPRTQSGGSAFNEEGSHNFKQRPIPGVGRAKQLSKVPTRINLVVIGTGGPGTSRSLLLTTEYTRYMFNCGEGSQRLAAMSKWLRRAAFAKVSGLENIFITHKSWENTGGLLGMAMTLEGQKNPDSRAFASRSQQIQSHNFIPKITIHGPPDVEKIALMAKKFSVASNLNIARGKGTYEDFCVTITPVPFYNSQVKSEKDEAHSQLVKRMRMNSESVKEDEAYCYIVQAKPPLPKINVTKCFEAGIKIGPMVGILQRGQSVVLEDGTVVRPEQVTDIPIMDNRPFLILECPSIDFFPSLIASSPLQEFTVDTVNKKSFSVIVHMTPKHVYDTAEYQSWMKSFHNSTDHLVINRDAIEADLTRVREHQARLNLVSNEIFPHLPAVENSEQRNIEGVSKNQMDKDKDVEDEEVSVMTPETERMLLEKKGKTALAFSGLIYVSRGKQPGFHIETDEFNCKELQDRYLTNPEFQAKLTELKQSIPTDLITCSEEDGSADDCSLKFPKVVFLGTGSSEPNRIRAQSCIVVQLSKHSVIMLDCGEDSYGQLYRFYGPSKARRILRNLKAIFISHMHGDHHLGLISLLKERKNAFTAKDRSFSPILLIAPIQMKRWLKFYHTELENITSLIRFVKLQDLKEYDDGLSLQSATFEDVLQELDLSEFTPVPVEHCPNSFGVSIKHSSSFKLVYSGDTMPCEALVQAGEKCDLLIHEATHEDSLSAHAKFSKHSTFSQAIDIGQKMEAKNIILTHFSQRYPHMVPFINMTLPSNVGIAFDNMQVNPQTMKHLPKLIPALTELFSEELIKSEIKTIKRIKGQAESGDTLNDL